MNEMQRMLLEGWLVALRTAQRANYRAASRSEGLNYWFGIPVVVLSAIVGTSVFSALGNHQGEVTQIVVGTLSVLSAILSAVHTSLRYSERAEKHRSAATSYAALQKELMQRLAAPSSDEAAVEIWITTFRQNWDSVAEEAPTVPKRIWESTLAEEQKHATKKERQRVSTEQS